jgi:hypothetical protein
MRTVGLVVVATLAVIVLLSGCGSRSEGQLGHASFAWEECLFGCSVTDNPMAAGGARAAIAISLAHGYSFTQLRSSNPSVATFALGSGGTGDINVSVVSGAPGRADLQLVDGTGRLVDQVTVAVTATAVLAQTKGWTGTAPLLLEGSSHVFHVTTEDANGHTLIGTGAVSFALTTPLRPTDALVAGDSLGFTGQAGDGTITAHCDSTSLTQPVTVVPLTALTGVDATVHANSSDANGVYANVDVVARSASGAVYGAPCGWTVNDASVTIQSQTTASLESAPHATTRFQLGRAGSFSATCAVGAVSTTVQLSR